MLTQNTALMGTRNGLPVDLQAGLQKVASIVRNSDNVLLYNLAPDDNAPTVKVGEAGSVPGPPEVSGDDDYRYFWRSTDRQLVLSQPSRTASGAPIYEDPAQGDFTGPRDSTVLYLKGKALYQRTVYDGAGAGNTLACPGVSEAGGCDDDIKLLDNIKIEGGVPLFSVTYLDGAGVPIPATLPSGQDNYHARKTTKAIKVDVTLEITRAGKAITYQDTSTTSFRKEHVPGSFFTNPGTGNVGVAPPYTMSGIYVGPGGLTLSGLSSFVTGSGLNVMGRVAIGGWSGLGTLAVPMNVFVGNQACGTPPDWPTSCAPTQPITGLTGHGVAVYGNVCATSQITSTNMSNPGLQPGCVSPQVNLPTYDRQAFVSSMKQQQSPSNASCSLLNFSAKKLGPDVQYVGSIEQAFIFCSLTVRGNVHVMGDFDVGSLTTIYVDDSVGMNRPIVLVDGDINMDFANNVVPNSYGTGIDFISFGSANASCLTTPACRDRTDMSVLYNSYNTPTVSLNWVSAPGSTFYSYYGAVNVGFGSNISGVAGQTVTIGGFASVNGP